MKAYPLIYSRTKNVDFVPDFLARPEDIDVNTALRYVSDAMKSLDGLNGIRYSAFEAGNYCICGGISCLTKHLFEQVKQEGRVSVSSFDEEYLKDCKGRNTAVFIGFAINRKDIVDGKIPDISLGKYWSVYLEHLKKQWDNSDTKSEKILIPDVELDEKIYIAQTNNEAEKIGDKYAIKNFNDNRQNILEYFYDLIMNKNTKTSFISDVRRIDDWNNLNFSCASVAEDLLTAIKRSPASAANNPYHIKTGSDSSSGYNKYAQKQNTGSPSVNTYGNYHGSTYGNTAYNKTPTSYNQPLVPPAKPEAKKKSAYPNNFSMFGFNNSNSSKIFGQSLNETGYDRRQYELEKNILDLVRNSNKQLITLTLECEYGEYIIKNIKDILNKYPDDIKLIQITKDKITIVKN